MSYDPRYLKFFELFNKREFFECHETLEDLWIEELGEYRFYYQGLIQTATAFFHIGNRNFPGAQKLFIRGLHFLDPFSSPVLGFDLEDYKAHCEEWLGRIRGRARGDEIAISCEDFPLLKAP